MIEHGIRRGRSPFRVAEAFLKGNNIMSVPVAGGEPRLVVKSAGEAGLNQARFSPDGRWVAYNSDATGRPEVFVVPFPPTGQRFPISSAGGVQPLWRGDGREIFYLDLNGNLMSVEVNSSGTFDARPPRLLFRTGLVSPGTQIEDYDVTDDGQRFLVALPVTANAVPTLKLILDWPALLGKQKQTRPAEWPPS